MAKNTFVMTGLLLLLVANILMVASVYYTSEGFQMKKAALKMPAKMAAPKMPAKMAAKAKTGFQNGPNNNNSEDYTEGFSSYFLENASGTKAQFSPMGAYDGIQLPTGNPSAWRYTAPNEPLMGDAFAPGPDSLFMFKNNQCKPECCGASFSCDGGCVCTTPDQRDYIASRGGNRTAPEDSA
jgi:hypothetical protein